MMTTRDVVIVLAVVGTAGLIGYNFFMNEVERRAAAGARAEVTNMVGDTAGGVMEEVQRAWHALVGGGGRGH